MSNTEEWQELLKIAPLESIWTDLEWHVVGYGNSHGEAVAVIERLCPGSGEIERHSADIAWFKDQQRKDGENPRGHYVRARNAYVRRTIQHDAQFRRVAVKYHDASR